MSDAVAQDQIKSIVERIIRMREEGRAINADIREIYAEAKGNGFDKTALGRVVLYVEKRTTKADALQEAEALFDLYLSAYDGATGTKVARAHTHETAETADASIPRSRPSGGGVEGGQSAQQDRSHSDHAQSGASTHSTAARKDVPPAAAGAGIEPKSPAGTQAPPVDTASAGNVDVSAGRLHSRVGVSTESPASVPVDNQSLPVVIDIGSHPSLPAEGDAARHPTNVVTLRNSNGLPRQPGCQRPDSCAGSWRARCRECELAFAVESGGTAIPHNGAVA